MTFKYNIKNVIASSALVAVSLAPGVSATGGVSSIPVGFDKRPQVELTKIDLTNNKLDFGFTMSFLPSMPYRFGAYIIDDTGVDDLSELGEDALVRAFWNDEKEAGDYYKYTANTTKHYVVPAEVDLVEESTGKMLYMAEFSEGSVWAHLIDYSECLAGWTLGKACVADTFEQDENRIVTQINYVLADVEIEQEEPGSGDEPSEPGDEPSEPGEPGDEPGENPDEPGEPGDEPGDDPGDEPGDEPIDEPGNVDEPSEPGDDPTEPSEPTETEDNPVETGRTDETGETGETGGADSPVEGGSVDTSVETAPTTKEVVEVVKTVYVNGNTGVSNNTAENSNNSSDDMNNTEENLNKTDTFEEDEETEEETLEVPVLGKEVENNNVLRNLSWILIFLAGTLTGTVSTWFLLSDHQKMKSARK